jgi:ankyrin repeat protein
LCVRDLSLNQLSQHLIDKGVDINSKSVMGETILITACKANNTEVIQRILGAGAKLDDINGEGKRPLDICVENDMIGIAISLIDAGATCEYVDSDDQVTVLQKTVTKVDLIEVTLKLIEKGANIHNKSTIGNSILSSACRNGNLEAARKLVELGARIDEANNSRERPIQRAYDNGHLELVTFSNIIWCNH